MVYSLRYGAFHWFVHFSLAYLLAVALKVDLPGYLIAFLATVTIDIDHYKVFKAHGINGLLNFAHARSYPLHNFFYLSIFIILGAIFLLHQFLFFGIAFAAIALHMGWDLFEDVAIFGIGIKHWKVRKIGDVVF